MKNSNYQLNIQLNNIKINNFRSFKEADIHFDNNLTIFIGINGSGKTSILDLLTTILRQYINMTHKFGKEEAILNGAKDVSIGFKESNNELDLEVQYMDYELDENYEPTDILIAKNAVSKCLYGLSQSKGAKFSFLNNEEFKDVTSIYESIFDELERKKINTVHLPILAYYPCGSINDNQDSVSSDYINDYVLDVYLDFLDGKKVNFKQLKKWFEWQQKRDLQRREKGLSNGDNAITSQIYANILAMLNDEDEPYSKIYIDWENLPEGEFILVKNGSELRENQLSSGEKMLFTLVADISAKMAVANPTSQNPSKDGVGVVLIDEIDLHLHPKWQRKVIGKLREIFPKVQFVVTTHSAMVLQNIQSKHVRVLNEGKIYASENTLGHSIDDILENTLGVDANLYEEEIGNLFEAISNNQLEKAETLIVTLAGKTEGKSADLIRAEAMINRKKMLSR